MQPMIELVAVFLVPNWGMKPEPIFVNIYIAQESIPRNQLRQPMVSSVGNLSPAMGARNQVGIGLSYRPASLCSLAT
jgi:hypothetical protein